MGQALYRKYRSKSLGEIVGQDHITTTLQNALKSGRISHAYLFTGPRGVGKTSIARILAYEINGLSYSDEAPLDVIEIDAASNRRIDEIRELRERVNTAPASAKYKVYIIDEVHMLTKEAFNALLKTLEEPPAHVVFILATTESYKLPETIISRTQRFNFRPAAVPAIMSHLKMIAQKENITIAGDAVALLAEHADGSFRDSVSLLDQASSISDTVTLVNIEAMLGLAPAEAVQQLIHALIAGNSGQLVETLSDLYGQGYEPAMLAAQLAAKLRAQLLQPLKTTDASPVQHLAILRELLDVPAARSPKQLLEIILLKQTFPPNQDMPQQTVATHPVHAPAQLQTKITAAPAPKSAKPDPAVEPKIAVVKPTSVADIPAERIVATAQKHPETEVKDLELADLWPQVLDQIKQTYNTLYGILRMATPELAGSQLTLRFAFVFHQKRINEPKKRKLISDIVEQATGQKLKIVCIVDPVKPGSAVPASPPSVHPTSQTISAISNIFGSAELLES